MNSLSPTHTLHTPSPFHHLVAFYKARHTVSHRRCAQVGSEVLIKNVKVMTAEFVQIVAFYDVTSFTSLDGNDVS
jgi:hypothetical protein